jgi:hypothetical protein
MNTSQYLGYEPPDFSNQDSVQTGMWCRLVAEPDSFTGERFNVGVGIIDAFGKRYAKVITERGRMECLFGASDADSVLMMASAAKKCFEAGTAPLFENITFGDVTPLLNREPQLALEELFLDQVTLAAPHRAESPKREGWLTREETQGKVYELIRQKIAVDRVGLLIPQNKEICVALDKDGPKKAVKVPLQTSSGVAGLESACYTPPTIRTHLMDAMLDVQAAANAQNLKQVGMFVLRPSAGASRKTLQTIRDSIDDVLWRAPRDWKIEVEDDPEILADRIVDWAELKAA